jgi:hypothetical protein
MAGRVAPPAGLFYLHFSRNNAAAFLQFPGQFFHEQIQEIGFIQYDGEIHVNKSLLSVVLHE